MSRLKEVEKQGGKNPGKGRGGQKINPNGQSSYPLSAVREIRDEVSTFGFRGIAADRTAALKKVLFAGKITGRAADRREISSAFRAVNRVSWYFYAAAFTKEMGIPGAGLTHLPL